MVVLFATYLTISRHRSKYVDALSVYIYIVLLLVLGVYLGVFH